MDIACVYVTLTEALDATLLTADARLADAVNRRATCATTLLRPVGGRSSGQPPPDRQRVPPRPTLPL